MTAKFPIDQRLAKSLHLSIIVCYCSIAIAVAHNSRKQTTSKCTIDPNMPNTCNKDEINLKYQVIHRVIMLSETGFTGIEFVVKCARSATAGAIIIVLPSLSASPNGGGNFAGLGSQCTTMADSQRCLPHRGASYARYEQSLADSPHHSTSFPGCPRRKRGSNIANARILRCDVSAGQVAANTSRTLQGHGTRPERRPL